MSTEDAYVVSAGTGESEEDMKSAFISHSRHDRRLAREIARAVEQLGGQVWIDEAELKIGDSLIEKIRDGIDSVDFVIALVSHHSVSSTWVSRELDVAMNQEIEGRRVKVLPVLATACELPGFLKGKLYADMTTLTKKRRSLPSLLKRLGASDEQLPRVLRGEPVLPMHDETWINEIRKAFGSGEQSVWYSALSRAVRRSPMKGTLLDHLDVLESVCSLLEDETPPHFKVQALTLVGMTADAGFAYRIEPLLRADDSHVVAAAAAALGALGSESACLPILETLQRTDKARVRDECLEFFSRVKAATSSIALTLLGVCDELLRKHDGDAGVQLLIAGALGNQLMADDADSSVGRRVLRLLATANDAVRLVLLKAIIDDYEDAVSIHQVDLQVELRGTLDDLSRSENPRIAAACWTVRALAAYLVEETRDRQAFWPVVKAGTESTLEIWLDMLEDYRVDYVFDEPEDVEGLVSLFDRFEGRIGERVGGLLCQLDFDRALECLVQRDYQPNGWEKVWILRKLTLVESWRREYARLLDAGLRDLQLGSNGAAWALLAQLKAGRIEMAELFAAFPGRIDDSYLDRRLGLDAIVEVLEDLGAKLNPPHKRRLSRLVGKLRT